MKLGLNIRITRDGISPSALIAGFNFQLKNILKLFQKLKNRGKKTDKLNRHTVSRCRRCGTVEPVEVFQDGCTWCYGRN